MGKRGKELPKPRKREDCPSRHNYPLALLILALACLLFLRLETTGFLVANAEAQYLKSIDEEYNKDITQRILLFESSPTSIKVTGEIKDGDAKIIIQQSDGTSYTVLDTTTLTADENGKKSFKDACEETCSLKDLEKSLEVKYYTFPSTDKKEAKLKISSFTYTALQPLEETPELIWTSEKTIFVVKENTALEMKLSDYFGYHDPRIERAMTFLATAPPTMSIDLINDQLIITPKPGFTGTETITLIASDTINNPLRKEITLDVQGDITEEELLAANSPAKVDEEIKDELALGYTSVNVIVEFRETPREVLAQTNEELYLTEKRIETKDVMDRFEARYTTEEEMKEYDPSYVSETQHDLDVKHQGKATAIVTGELTEKGLVALLKDPKVESIKIDRAFGVALNDTLSIIEADVVHTLDVNGTYLTGKGQALCVLDTGTDLLHEAYTERIIGGYDFVNDDLIPEDDNEQGHGTHMTGIAAAAPYNGSNLSGVAPEADLVIVKVCNSLGECKMSDIMAGIDYCINNKDIFNIKAITGSFGDNQEWNTSSCPDYFDNLLEISDLVGMTTVFSTGNQEFNQGINYPACNQYSIGVGATTKQDELTSFTNVGEGTDLLAPGQNVISTTIGGGYASLSGTSVSTPHVAAAAILLYQHEALLGNEILPSTIKQILKESGEEIGAGYPRLNVYATMEQLATGNYSVAPSEYIINESLSRVENQHGAIQFASPTFMQGITDCLVIKYNHVELDSTLCPEYSKEALIEIHNLPYQSNVKVLKDNEFCNEEICTNVLYNNTTGSLNFTVPGFSVYSATGNFNASEEANFTVQAEATSSTCGTVSASLTLTGGVISNGGTCFTINAKNIVLDGNGSTVICAPAPSCTAAIGINNTGGFDGITIKNFAGLNSFLYGIQSIGMASSTISNITLTTTQSSGHGIYLSSDDDNNTINNNNITTSAASANGIRVDTDGEYNQLTNNIVTTSVIANSAAYGVYLSGDHNRITGGTITSTGSPEIYLNNGDYSNITFTNVIIRNSGSGGSFNFSATNVEDVYIDVNSSGLPSAPVGKRIIGTSESLVGLNIVDVGAVGASINLNITYLDSQIGGAIEDTIRIYDYDGGSWEVITNTSVNPATNEVFGNRTTFSTFAPLGNTTCPIYVNSNIVQTENIVSAAGDCYIVNVSNVIIDGNGYTLTGDGSSGSGIRNPGNFHNITIKNFYNISNFLIGINFSTSINNTFSNNSLETLSDSNAFSINLNNVNTSVIDRNVINVQTPLVATLPTVVRFINSYANNLTNNNITNIQSGTTIVLQRAHNTSIISNNINATAAGNSGAGIESSAGSSNNGNNITSNTIHTVGVSVSILGNETVIASNTITTTGATSLTMQGNSTRNRIQGNTITNTVGSAYGVLLSPSANNNLIDTNRITTTKNGAYGIYLTNSNNSNITSNDVVVTGSTSYTIYLSNAHLNRIISNSANSSSAHTIYLVNANDNTINTNNINATGDLASGLYLLTSSNQIANQNKIFVTGSNGVGITVDTGNNNSFTGDTVLSNGSASIGLNMINADANTFTNLLVNATTGKEISVVAGSDNTKITGLTLMGLVNFTTPSISRLSININESPRQDTSGLQNLSDYITFLDIGGTSYVHFNLTYGENEISSIRESSIRLYRYNHTTSLWDGVQSSSVDTLNNILNSGNISSFSTFASMGNTSMPSLSVTKSDSPDPVTAGQQLDYTITITNGGNATASNVNVTDIIPENMTYQSSNPPTAAGQTVNWSINVTAGGISTITLNVTVSSETANGTVRTNTVNVTYDRNTISTVNATVDTTIIKSSATPNIVLTKIDSPDPVHNGSNIIYTITLNNTGDAAAFNVTIDETFDGNTTFVSATPAANNSPTNTSWFIESLNAGNHTTINITRKVNSTTLNATPVNNTLVARYNTSGATSASTPYIANASILTTVVSAPHLEFYKLDSPDPVRNGSEITYTIVLNNTGGTTARNVTFVETYDGNTTGVRVVSPAANSTANITWFIENLYPGNHSTINITVRVNSSVANGTPINNTVFVTYNDSLVASYFRSNASIVTSVSHEPVLVVTKSDTDPVQNGSNMVYTFIFNNTGFVTVYNISLFETFDGNTTFVSATPAASDAANTEWFIARIFPGNHSTINITQKVNSTTLNATSVNNTAFVTYNDSIISTYLRSNVSILTTVVSSPHLEFYKLDSPDPVQDGSTIDYVIVINNTGGTTAKNVTFVEVAYDGNTTHVSLSPVANNSPTNTTWFFENIYPGNHTTINITRRVNTSVANGTPINNTVFVTYNDSQFPSYFRSNASILTTVINSPILVVTKVDSPDPVQNGSEMTYTIVLNNTGGSTAWNITIAETFDANTSFVIATPNANNSPTNTIWFVERIFPGNHSTINITRKVNSATQNATTLNNTIRVSYNETQASSYWTSNASILTTVISSPHLEFYKIDNPDPVHNGSNIDYVIVINNTGGTTARNVTFVETFYDANTTHVSLNPVANNSPTNTTWFFENLYPGNHTTINITRKVNSAIANGTTINNTVFVTYNDSSFASYFRSNASILTTVSTAPVIVLTKVDSPDPVRNGSTIDYVIVINNTGGTTAWNISVVEIFDGNTTFVSATPAANNSPTNTTWFIERVFPGNHTTINITRRVNSTTLNGTTVNNTVRVTYNETQVSSSWSSNVSILTSVTSPVHLDITKVDSADPVNVGEQLSYNITIVNTGGSTAVNANLSDFLPEGVTYHSSEPSTSSGTTINWTITIPAGNTTVINITVNISASIVNNSLINNTANVSYDNGTIVTVSSTQSTLLLNTTIECGQTISSNKNITKVLTTGTTSCLNITGPAVVTCQSGITITGQGTGSAFEVRNTQHVRIENCITINFTQGFNITGSSNITLFNDTSRNNTFTGFRYTVTNDSRLINSTTYDNPGSSDGVSLISTNNTNILENNISATIDGIILQSSSQNNNLTGNTISVSSDSGNGILLEVSPRNNRIERNNVTSLGTGVFLASSNNIMDANTINASGSTTGAIAFSSGNSNTITNNRLNAKGSNTRGYSISSSHSNVFSGNTILVETGSSNGAIHLLSGATGNNFTNEKLNATSSAEISSLSGASNNRITGALLNGEANFTSHYIFLVFVNDSSNVVPADPRGKRKLSHHNLTINQIDVGAYVDYNLTYTSTDIQGILENTIRIHRYNTTSGAWESFSTSTVDATNNIVSSGNVTTFSDFSPLGNLPANLTVTKTDTPDSVAEGQQLNYTITINNTGGEAVNVNVTDELPRGITFHSSNPSPSWQSGQLLNWTLNISAETNVTINITTNVTSAFHHNDVMNNTVNVSYDTGTTLSTLNATQSTTLTSVECGQTLTGTQSIIKNINATGVCFNITGPATISCNQGVTILGTGTGSAFEINNTEDILIRDCITINFTQGFNVTNSNNITFINDSSRENTFAGFRYNNVNISRVVNSTTFNNTGSASGVSIVTGINITIELNSINMTNANGHGINISSNAISTNMTSNQINVSGTTAFAINAKDSNFPFIAQNTIYSIVNYSNVAHAVVVLDNSNNGTIKSNTITTTGTAGRAIQLLTTSNTTVIQNTLSTSASGGTGVFVRVSSHNNNISDNVITATTTVSGSAIGIQQDADYNTVSNNTITVNTGFALRFFGDTRGNMVRDNNITVTGSSSQGIAYESYSGGANTITANNITARGSSADGILASSTVAPSQTITNNRITTTSGDGIDFHGINNNTITDNIIATTTGMGISVVSTTNSSINDTIHNNNITTTSGIGIRFTGNTTNITYNNITTSSSGGDGMNIIMREGNISFNRITTVTGGEGITLSSGSVSIDVHNNTISTGTSNSYALYLNGVDSSRIFSNTITSTGSDGIRIENTAVGNNVTSNTFTISGGTQAVEVLSSSSNNSILLNTLSLTGSSITGFILNAVNDNKINNNTITGMATSTNGFNLQSSSPQVRSNVIANNTILVSGTGMTIQATNNNISENIITTNQSNSPGLYLGVVASTNNFVSNRITTNSTSSEGIRLETADGNTFLNDHVNASNSVELNVSDGADNNLITGMSMFSVENFSSHHLTAVSVNVNDATITNPTGRFSLPRHNLTINSLAAGAYIDYNLTYTDADIPTRVVENTIRTHRYNTTSAAWESLSTSTVDTANNIVSSGNITTFSNFTPFGRIPPNISITKTVGPLQTTAGDPLIYSIIINNTGGDAEGINITDTLPSGTTFHNATPPPTSQSGQELNWTLDVNASQARSINITVNVTPTVGNGTVIINTINTSYSNGTNVTTITNTSANITVVRLNISIEKTDAPDPVLPGHDLTYTIIVRNRGEDNRTVTVTESYPDRFSFLNATPSPSSGNNTWIFNMSAKNSTTITITGRVLTGVGRILENNVTAVTNGTNNISANATQNTTTDIESTPGGGGGAGSGKSSAPAQAKAVSQAAAAGTTVRGEPREEKVPEEIIPEEEQALEQRRPLRLVPGPTCAVSKGLVYITLALGLLLIIGVTMGGFLEFKKSRWFNTETVYLVMAANAGILIFIYLACGELLFYAILANVFVTMTNYLFSARGDEEGPLGKVVGASRFVWKKKDEKQQKSRKKR
ncbi:DUF11 domain-containing protein [Candidatus Woesearchaeota archaeon]|nr:DUF11 domain-containing protein [Candidatus Woesearchaeota archaeon]